MLFFFFFFTHVIKAQHMPAEGRTDRYTNTDRQTGDTEQKSRIDSAYSVWREFVGGMKGEGGGG